MTKVAVVIPWRPTPDRERAFRAVWNWYVGFGPRFIDRIMAIDSGHLEFSRAGSRNAGVRAAGDADVVIINDADTIPHEPAVVAAIAQAADGRLHFGLDRMKYLSEHESEMFYDGHQVDVSDARQHDSSVLVCQPSTWWRFGGEDERFSGYGGEDNARTIAARTMVGVHWHKGTAVSLYHDPSVRDIGSERWKPNSKLMQRYLATNGSPLGIQRVIAERDYPGAVVI